MGCHENPDKYVTDDRYFNRAGNSKISSKDFAKIEKWEKGDYENNRNKLFELCGEGPTFNITSGDDFETRVRNAEKVRLKLGDYATDLEFIPIDPHTEMIRTVESVENIPPECDRCFAFGGSRWHYIEFESRVNREKSDIKYGTYKGGSVTENHYYSALFIAIKLIEAGFEGKSILIAGAPTRSVVWGTEPGQQNPGEWYKVDFVKFCYNIGNLGKRGKNIINIIEHVYELVFPFIV
jgi:hypothetical protein